MKTVIYGSLNRGEKTVWLNPGSQMRSIANTKAKTRLANAMETETLNMMHMGNYVTAFFAPPLDKSNILELYAEVLEENSDAIPEAAMVAQLNETDWEKQKPVLFINAKSNEAKEYVVNLLQSNVQWLKDQESK